MVKKLSKTVSISPSKKFKLVIDKNNVASIKKVRRPKEVSEILIEGKLIPIKVKYDNLSIPLKIAFVFSWSMIVVLVVLTIKSFI